MRRNVGTRWRVHPRFLQQSFCEKDAEVAADDAALLSGVKPSAYAAEPLHCAASLASRQPSSARLAVPIVGSSAIENENRVDFGSQRSTPEQAWKAIAAANMVVFVLISLPPKERAN